VESIIIISLIGYLENKIRDNNKILDILSLVGILAVIASLVYIQLKPCPMAYDSTGALLVDPQKMMNDGFKACGAFLGFIIGSIIERYVIHYEIPVGSKSLPFMTCIGVGLAMAWKDLFAPATIVIAFGGHWGNFISRFLMLIFVMCIWPAVIQNKCKKEKKKAGVAKVQEL
jgi:hypothetical protein